MPLHTSAPPAASTNSATIRADSQIGINVARIAMIANISVRNPRVGDSAPRYEKAHVLADPGGLLAYLGLGELYLQANDVRDALVEVP